MNYKNDKPSVWNEPAEAPSLQDVDKILYGESVPPASGRVVAKPIDIMQIWPDLKQPRRAIPALIRGKWNGDPYLVPDLLGNWKLAVQRLIQERFPPFDELLTGMAAFPEEIENDPRTLVQGLVSLIRLAHSIHQDGLINPITIYEAGGRLNILTGERRWLAYLLLYSYFDREQWGKIPAQTVAYNVKQQVSENMARRDLNAIGLARCFALVCMDIVEREQGPLIRQYEAMVRPGECDRKFYAQIDKTPYGYGQEVMAALNITTYASLKNYLDILKMPDDKWQEADDNDWGIRECLAIVRPESTKQNLQHVLDSPSETRQESRFREFPRSDSTFADDGDGPVYRTVVGERMGLYGDSPSPAGDHAGSPLQEQARPVITYLSTDAEWKAAGYVYCPHPDEMEPGEQWTDDDEALAAEAARLAAEIDANALEQNNTPISVEQEFTLLDALIEVARGLEDRKTAQTLTYIRNRGREDIRQWMLANNGDMAGFQKKLEGEAESVGYMLDMAKEKLWDFMAHIWHAAHEVVV